MVDLKGLRAHLLFNGVEVTEFDGAALKTKAGDVWGMAHGDYYRNGELVPHKQIRIDYPKRKV